MIDRGKRSILGVGIDVVDYDGALARILGAAAAKKPLAVAALAVHGVMTGVLDPEQNYRLNRLGLITPDGQPVRWALRILHGEKLPDRVYGPELTLRLCEAAETMGLSLYLYGSRSEVLNALCANLTLKFPNLRIAGFEPSKFRKLSPSEAEAARVRIVASQADIVLVGLGCPRQEVFVYEHAETISRPMLAVGAAFDFHAGQLKQAPKWMQDRGLEWLFRLAAEPKRLWRRYVLLNPAFVFWITCQRLGLASARFGRQSEPRELVRHG